ncbi:MAG: hypothetical protein LUD78_02735 [Clostridiales bacterium]|nr:hypothetical protein [Clostridiales bacterium]
MRYNGIVYDVTGAYETEYFKLAKAFREADAVIVGGRQRSVHFGGV